MKFGFRTLLVAVLFCLAGVNNCAAELSSRINSIINRPSQKKVSFAVNVVEGATGRTAYSRNAAQAMVPASNMKLIITAAALKFLGPDFQYTTTVGLADSTLVVIGGGDPLLGDAVYDEQNGRDHLWILDDIAQRLKAQNIAGINDIIVDTTVFDDERVHPSWPQDQLNRWYACEVAGLNFNANCVEVIAESSGGAVRLTLYPATSFVELINNARPASSGPDTVWCARKLSTNTITVLGKCHKQCQPIRVAIERPAAFFAYLLAERLPQASISVAGRFIEGQMRGGAEFRQLAVYQTKLEDVLSRCNKDSLGLAAECLLKTIAAHPETGGRGGSWDAGRQVVLHYLQDLGISADEFHIDDGSGLSTENRLSAKTITTVLLSVYKEDYWPTYQQSLAVGGVDGTIAKYFKEKEYRAKIFGKTGYIDSVKSFSGLASTAQGDYLFSILANNANGNTRGAINDIAEAIIDEFK